MTMWNPTGRMPLLLHPAYNHLDKGTQFFSLEGRGHSELFLVWCGHFLHYPDVGSLEMQWLVELNKRSRWRLITCVILWSKLTIPIWDMIKGNEWIGGWEYWLWVTGQMKWYILMFTVFWTSKNCSYLCNQMSDWDAVWIKMQHFKWTNDLYWKKSKLNFADMWLIPLDHITYSI